jgi:peptide deformylase
LSVKPIRLFGDPVLRTPAEPVRDFDAELRRLVKDLTDTMMEAPGVGLAAPQIGVGLAVFSYLVDDQLGYLINPEITEQCGEQDGPEGCLSIPGVTALRARAAVAVARGVDLDQRPVLVTGTGELARALQHETDHLRGELYIDALTGRERRSVLRQIREQQAG